LESWPFSSLSIIGNFEWRFIFFFVYSFKCAYIFTFSGPRSFWLAFGVAMIVVMLVGICLWVPQFWQNNRNSINIDLENFENLSDSPGPSRSNSTVSEAFFKLDSLCSSLTARIFIFLLVTAAVGACGLVDLVNKQFALNFNQYALKYYWVTTI
jgi:undecaprenyl pyrophosphate phosphatase UppP